MGHDLSLEPPRAAARRLRPSISWLLAFVPIALALEHGGARPPLVFFAAALAIVPVAAWIVRSTEQLAHYTGDAVGGLLNATFGNAPELIICAVALRARTSCSRSGCRSSSEGCGTRTRRTAPARRASTSR